MSPESTTEAPREILTIDDVKVRAERVRDLATTQAKQTVKDVAAQPMTRTVTIIAVAVGCRAVARLLLRQPLGRPARRAPGRAGRLLRPRRRRLAVPVRRHRPRRCRRRAARGGRSRCRHVAPADVGCARPSRPAARDPAAARGAPVRQRRRARASPRSSPDTETPHLLEHIAEELMALSGSPRWLKGETAWDFGRDGRGVFRVRARVRRRPRRARCAAGRRPPSSTGCSARRPTPTSRHRSRGCGRCDGCPRLSRTRSATRRPLTAGTGGRDEKLPARAYYVAGGITLGMLAYGVLAAVILVVTRRRADRATWLRALLVVGVTMLFILLMAAGWISVALGAPRAGDRVCCSPSARPDSSPSSS